MSDQEHTVSRGLLVAACITCAGVGVLLGALFCMPIVPYTIPESSAALLGAAVGSLVTVSAAWWLSTHKERQARAEGRELIRRQLWAFRTEFAQAMDDVAAALSEGQDSERWEPLRKRLEGVSGQAPAAMGSIDDLRPLFVTLGPHGVLCRAGLTRAITNARDRIDDVLNRGMGFLAAEEEHLLRNLHEINRELARL
ncbi:hypothetical protein LJR143_002228 [Pseudoxanthomonas sp. LjRoot143]|uniref:hypothetical protein n=1 Tax=Pseudoxanthomonas sp. LjRoot143 TaxID=3342266 RepID=UPI003ECE7916